LPIRHKLYEHPDCSRLIRFEVKHEVLLLVYDCGCICASVQGLYDLETVFWSSFRKGLYKQPTSPPPVQQ